MMRFLHLVVACAFVAAAAYVYKIKFDSAVQAERVAKIRSEIRRERDNIAMLRAEWARLDNPTRIQSLADRHLKLRPLTATQFDSLDQLPERVLPPASPAADDPISAIIENADGELPTGSVEGAGQ